jgi:tetratricopeptide (TPR) repeat protein
MDVLNRVRRWRPSWPGLAWLVPTALGGALRFYHAASLSGVWTPHLDRGEGYYEGAINFLGYRVLAERVPSFIPLGTRGPLYQAFIVAVESLFSSPHPGHVILAQAALSTLAIAAVYELGSELASPWAGLLAALWMALDFGQIELVGRLDLAVFYQLAILALAAALIGWAKAPSRKRTVLLAATLASTLICRSAHYAFPFLLAAGCLTLPRWKDARRALPLLAAATGLFLGVAVATNSARFGRLMPLDAETGSVRFYAATVGEPCCSEGQTERYRAAATDGGRSAEGASSAEGAILSRGFRNIRERPLVFARSFARNAAAFWRPFAAALILGLAAAFTHGLEPGFQALLLTLLSFLGYHVLVVYPWHSSVVMPLLAVLAGLGLGSAHRLLGKKHLSADFFCRPRDAGWARGALVCVFAGLYAVVLALFAAERLSAGTHRIADALGDPSASAHRAPLALLDLSVASSRGRYGLEERSNVLAAMGLYARACADLASLARLDPSSVALARRARLCASESALGQEGLVLIKSMARSPAGRREMTTDLRLATPCDWPQWGRPDSIGRAFLDRCVLASPRNPFSRENRGVSRYLAGDKKGAAEDFRAAVRADPDFAQAFLSLSTVLFELGRAKDALAAAERALALAARSRDPALRAAALDSVASVRRALKLPPLVIDDAQTPARVAQAPPAAGAVSASVRKVPISAAALPALKSAPSEAAALREAELAHYAAAEAIF